MPPSFSSPWLPAFSEAIYNRIGMGLEVWVYAGLTKAGNVDVDMDGYPRDWRRFWRAAVVDSTEFTFPGRAEGLEQDAIYAYTSYSEFQAGTAKDIQRLARHACPARRL